MAEDLGQDIGEWLLNNKSEIWKYMKVFGKKAKDYIEAHPKDEIVKLDFESNEEAEKICDAISGMNLECQRIESSVVMTRKTAEKAAEWMDFVEDKMPSQEVSVQPHEQPQDSIESSDDKPEPLREDPVKEQEFTPCTEKQREYMENLKADGFIKPAELPDDLNKFSTRDADKLIKTARSRADEAKGIVRVKDEGEACKAASKKLAQEKSSQVKDKVIDKTITR